MEQLRKRLPQESDEHRTVKSSRVTRKQNFDNSVSFASNIDSQDDCIDKGGASGHSKSQRLHGSFQQDVNDQEPKNGLLFVEIFAGSAKLSASAHERGF